MRLVVDPWDPSYGMSNDATDVEESEIAVELTTELPLADWTPRRPSAADIALASGQTITFVDGVRRVEARVWIESERGMVPGVCASWAAGAVCCAGSAATIPRGAVEVGRSIAAPVTAEFLTVLPTRHGSYLPVPARGARPEDLWLAVQDQMGLAEMRVATVAATLHPTALLLVDGPLRGREQLNSALSGGVAGLVKTHHVRYLPPGPAERTLATLVPGERTPVFTIGGSGGFARHSWYVRLPGAASDLVPLGGVVRCECPVNRRGADLIDFADRLTAALPRFASSAHKDRRAPQNLTPIAGLERRLRHLLGDPAVLYRALRSAAAVV